MIIFTISIRVKDVTSWLTIGQSYSLYSENAAHPIAFTSRLTIGQNYSLHIEMFEVKPFDQLIDPVSILAF